MSNDSSAPACPGFSRGRMSISQVEVRLFPGIGKPRFFFSYAPVAKWQSTRLRSEDFPGSNPGGCTRRSNKRTTISPIHAQARGISAERSLGWMTWAKAQSRHSFLSCGLVAQLVEQRPFKAWVPGSIPGGITSYAHNSMEECSPPKAEIQVRVLLGVPSAP